MLSDWFCKKCNLQFGKKYVFDLHLSLEHGEKIEIKNEPLDSEEVFQEPQASKKVADTCLKCEICSSLFKTKRNLKGQVESVHEGKKSFICNICDTSFAKKTQLKVHIEVVHEGKKPFKCNVCDACFTAKPSLNKHIVSIHEGKIQLNHHVKGNHENE